MAPKHEKNKKSSYLVNAYLFAYNLIQSIGWSYLLYQICNFYIFPPKEKTLWDVVKYTVIIFQNAACIEIFNVAVGYVKSNLIVTIQQVLSRVAIVAAIVYIPETTDSPGLCLALTAWCFAEITRYLYYGFNILGFIPYLLVWARYTLFIILYPLGVSGELLIYWTSLNYVGKTKMWSLELPNKYNIAFSLWTVIAFVMFIYIPLFPQMYIHMVHQRKKVLTSPGPKKVQKKLQ
ncbi:very-long-chain (3R)-3-hydroxyacyl-CoA dehydratase hpo-8-like [Daktulosphaira vitifoliae]|uniref:very-long-chain (3R)-3-hydroxyacyl-CoA dehydratase hpo-8-like n=1 Tax=Daktulosphaira vitifoliae TaxID=58002 RepID=UPI0021AA332F|nr:very-long-chain (3R)-3-hydroxyacyl-CoA dehydratase hpo-8-like [Daktulosphaira vitifoliae]